MHFVVFFVSLFLSGCTALPQLSQSLEHIATDDAIKISVDKDAFQKQTDVRVTVEVINRDHPDETR